MSLKWVLDVELSRGGQGFKDGARLMRELRLEAERTQRAFSNIGGGFGAGGGGANNSIKIVQNLRQEINQTSKAMGSMSSSGSSMGSALSVGFGVALVAVKALGAAFSAASAAFSDFTKEMIDNFSSRNAAIRSYKIILGSAREAEEEYLKAGAIGQRSDFTKEQVLKQQSALIKQGLRGKELERGLYSVLDIGTSNPIEQREGAMNRMQLLFRNVLTMGRMNMKDYKMAASLIGGGEGGTTSPLSKILQKAMGVSEEELIGNPAKKGKSRGLLSKGLVGANIAIPAIEQAVLEHLNTQKLGEFTVAGAGDLKTLISNKEEAFQNLSQSFDSNVLPGVQKYKQSLDDASKSIYSNTDESQKLGLVYQDLANSAANVKGIWQDFTKSFLESFSSSYLEELHNLGFDLDKDQTKFDSVGASAKEFATALGKVGGFAADVVHSFENMGEALDRVRTYVDHLKESYKGLFQYFAGVGKGLKGLYKIATGDIKEGFGLLVSATGEEWEGAKKWAKEGYAGSKALLTGEGVVRWDTSGSTLKPEFRKESEASKRAREVAEKNKKELEKPLPNRPEGIRSSVHGGGGGSGGISMGSFSIGGTFAPSSMTGSISSSMGGGLSIPANAIVNAMSSTASIIPANITVQSVNINVPETGLSSEEVANAVYDKFVSQMNRLPRNPTSVRA